MRLIDKTESLSGYKATIATKDRDYSILIRNGRVQQLQVYTPRAQGISGGWYDLPIVAYRELAETLREFTAKGI